MNVCAPACQARPICRSSCGYTIKCRNGLIAPDTIVQFKFALLQRNLGMGIRFVVARERLEKLQATLAAGAVVPPAPGCGL